MNAEDLIQKQAGEYQLLWTENAFYERLLNMRRDNPKTFDSMSPPAKLALLQYEANKRKFELLNDSPRIESCKEKQYGISA